MTCRGRGQPEGRPGPDRFHGGARVARLLAPLGSLPMQPVPLVRVIRSGVEESVHYGSVAVADADGRVVASAGDVGRVAFARSSMKPLQAAVSLDLAGGG